MSQSDWLMKIEQFFWLVTNINSDLSEVNAQQNNLTSLPGPISVVKILTNISIDFLANQTNQSESISPTPTWEPIDSELDNDQSGLRQSRKFLRASDGIIRNWISMNWYNIQNFCTGHRCYTSLFWYQFVFWSTFKFRRGSIQDWNDSKEWFTFDHFWSESSRIFLHNSTTESKEYLIESKLRFDRPARFVARLMGVDSSSLKWIFQNPKILKNLFKSSFKIRSGKKLRRKNSLNLLF